MKSGYLALILALIVAVCGTLGYVLLRGDGEAATRAEIRSGGELVRVVDLRVDQEFTVRTDAGYNVVTVSAGRIAVTDADCPDGYCMARGFCNTGAQIVCLPHGLVITFLDGDGVDAAA